MKKRELKINFVDFWAGFNKTDNYFWNLLSRHYDLKLSENPDVLFYSVFGKRNRMYKCYKVFYTGENIRPNFKECDFAFTFDLIEHPQHFRLPLYLLYDDVNKLTLQKDINQIVESKTDFCAFLVSNPDCKERIDFFKKLNAVRSVNSGGRIMNNIEYVIDDKMAFIKTHKFVIAYENCSYPGYTTEKIFEAFLADTIPIYWGDPMVHIHFNPKRFLNRLDFESDELFIQEIIRIDNDPIAFKEMLSQPVFYNNVVPKELSYQFIESEVNKVIGLSHVTVPVAISNPRSRFIGLFHDIIDLGNFFINALKRQIKRRLL